MTIKRKFSPVRSDDKLEYTINGEVVNVTLIKQQEPVNNPENGELEVPPPVLISDEFDFTGLPDGEADIYSFETSLPFNPFVSARRVDGVLEIELINYIGVNATEQERFPEWEVI